LQSQEEAACACPASPTTGVLLTDCMQYQHCDHEISNPSAVTQSSWALPLRYYRAITFLLCRINKPKMNELSATVVKNQPFQLLWRPFPYLRLKLNRLESNSVVTIKN